MKSSHLHTGELKMSSRHIFCGTTNLNSALRKGTSLHHVSIILNRSHTHHFSAVQFS